MDKLQTLIDILAESRNGTDDLIRHPLCHRMRYSAGVKEIAESLGAYWLLDIIATECVDKFIAAYDRREVGAALIEIKVAQGKADLSMTFFDGKPAQWSRHIDYTDLPDHPWTLALGAAWEGSRTVCNLILLTEY